MPPTLPLTAKVKHITALNADILQVILQPIQPNTRLAYTAGQYLFLQAGNRILPYSIANAPQLTGEIELHIRDQTEDIHTQELLLQLRQQHCVRITAVGGCCHLPESGPLLLLVGGTGFAVASALLQEMQQRQDNRPVQLCWATRNLADIYLPQQLEHYLSTLPHCHCTIFTTCAAGETCNNLPSPLKNLNITTQRLEQALQSQAENKLALPASTWKVVAAGPATLVEACWQALQAQGVQAQNFYTDMIEIT